MPKPGTQKKAVTLEELKNKELQAMCRRKKLHVSGTKAELIKRLRQVHAKHQVGGGNTYYYKNGTCIYKDGFTSVPDEYCDDAFTIKNGYSP